PVRGGPGDHGRDPRDPRRRMEQGDQRGHRLGVRGGVHPGAGLRLEPRGNKLVYLRSDESAVPEFSMAMYMGQLYPSEYRFKYPKAGEANSTVSLHVYDL